MEQAISRLEQREGGGKGQCQIWNRVTAVLTTDEMFGADEESRQPVVFYIHPWLVIAARADFVTVIQPHLMALRPRYAQARNVGDRHSSGQRRPHFTSWDETWSARPLGLEIHWVVSCTALIAGVWVEDDEKVQGSEPLCGGPWIHFPIVQYHQSRVKVHP